MKRCTNELSNIVAYILLLDYVRHSQNYLIKCSMRGLFWRLFLFVLQVMWLPSIPDQFVLEQHVSPFLDPRICYFLVYWNTLCFDYHFFIYYILFISLFHQCFDLIWLIVESFLFTKNLHLHVFELIQYLSAGVQLINTKLFVLALSTYHMHAYWMNTSCRNTTYFLFAITTLSKRHEGLHNNWYDTKHWPHTRFPIYRLHGNESMFCRCQSTLK